MSYNSGIFHSGLSQHLFVDLASDVQYVTSLRSKVP